MHADAHIRVSTWGPPTWDCLFSIAFHHPREDREHLWKALLMLQSVLPCPKCRKSYLKFLKRSPPDVNRDDDEYVAKWLWSVKDAVNQKLGKRYMSYPDLRDRHMSFRLAHDRLLEDMVRAFGRAEDVERDALRAFARYIASCSGSVSSDADLQARLSSAAS